MFCGFCLDISPACGSLQPMRNWSDADIEPMFLAHQGETSLCLHLTPPAFLERYNQTNIRLNVTAIHRESQSLSIYYLSHRGLQISLDQPPLPKGENIV